MANLQGTGQNREKRFFEGKVEEYLGKNLIFALNLAMLFTLTFPFLHWHFFLIKIPMISEKITNPAASATIMIIDGFDNAAGVCCTG